MSVKMEKWRKSGAAAFSVVLEINQASSWRRGGFFMAIMARLDKIKRINASREHSLPLFVVRLT